MEVNLYQLLLAKHYDLTVDSKSSIWFTMSMKATRRWSAADIGRPNVSKRASGSAPFAFFLTFSGSQSLCLSAVWAGLLFPVGVADVAIARAADIDSIAVRRPLVVMDETLTGTSVHMPASWR